MVPGSTLEWRLELAAAEPAASKEDSEPIAKSAVSPTGRPIGLTVLPHTGDVSLLSSTWPWAGLCSLSDFSFEESDARWKP